MKMDISKTLLEYNKLWNNYTNKENQTEIGQKGYMLITITSKNTGSKDAYQTSYKFIFDLYEDNLKVGSISKNIIIR